MVIALIITTKFQTMKILATYIGIFLLFCSCSVTNQDIPEAALRKRSVNILILGNSVLWHPASESLGWYGDWGMAASSAENDFLHLYSSILKSDPRLSNVQITARNISTWENTMQLDQNLVQELTENYFDIIIIRLGENVSNTSNYTAQLQSLIDNFRLRNTEVIITGTIWKNNLVESTHKNLAAKENYKYVSFNSFRSSSRNFSFGKFANSAVAAHPSDQGMNEIATLLAQATFELIK